MSAMDLSIVSIDSLVRCIVAALAVNTALLRSSALCTFEF